MLSLEMEKEKKGGQRLEGSVCVASSSAMAPSEKSDKGWGEEASYPDSVRRVKPPKTTIPKTLAALPRSQ